MSSDNSPQSVQLSAGKNAAEEKSPRDSNRLLVFSSGAVIGSLGGLIGLGGAEFRLPLLIGVFGFGALEAIILNKAMSLIVVAVALPFRTASVPLMALVARGDIIFTLLAGSMAGAWFGADWATRLNSQTLYRCIAILLLAIAAVLFWGHAFLQGPAFLTGWPLVPLGVLAGAGIGIVAAILGVAGGELLIPTIMILYGVDIKLAGSLSLVVSLPTMITAFSRYRRDNSFKVIKVQRGFILLMAIGSMIGAFVGGQLLGVVPAGTLHPLLSVILIISSIKIWRHAH